VSIRRKLFLAFVAAAALPLLAMSVLARLYLQRAREDVERDFLRHAKEAARAVRDRAGDRTDILKAALRRLGREIFEPEDEKPFPELYIFPQGWLDTPEGKADHAKLIKTTAEGVEIRRKVKARIEGRLEDGPSVDDHVKRFRDAHPQVLGVRVVLEDETLFDSLSSKRDLVLDPPMAAGEERDLVYTDPDGHHYMVWARHGGTTRIVIEIDALLMLEPMTVGGVKAFYLDGNGQAHHSPEVSRELARELPLQALAQDLPLAGESRQVKAGQEWRVLGLTVSERDRWDYGGNAHLVAVAPEALIEAPLRRFRAEVAAAGLVSLLIAIGLSYFLSGRFSESVENLKRGVDALSRGEYAQLEKSSGDELGGELVESMNRMASALAERTRKEEIESWRRLVRVLSHEINNTLGPVKSVAATVRDQLAPSLQGETGDDLKSAFKLIVDRVDSLSSFISGYAVLAKLPPPRRELNDLNEVVRGAVSMLSQSLEPLSGSRISVEEDYGDVGTPACPLLIDKEQIERVAINLVKNAVEAAASEVRVATARRADTVELRVEDDGPGIAAEARAHLFVPYYTTKPGGSGIGLALARQIVLGHGGTIATRDREGGGTIVTVLLPSGVL
jgi:signal transduction histidine kinase